MGAVANSEAKVEKKEHIRCDKGAFGNRERIILTVRGVIDARDGGIRALLREYKEYKREFYIQVRDALAPIVKNREIPVYGQQKWNLLQDFQQYIQNYAFHPMPFHNQSVTINKSEEGFSITFKIHPKNRGSEGNPTCRLYVPKKYRNWLEKACGENNSMLGEVRILEDKQYGRLNVHITLRLTKPDPYEPKGWVGVDIGWNKLASSIFCSANPSLKFSNPTVHGKEYKTRIIQLKHLLKQYARKGKAWKKWNFRLKHTIRYAVGVVTKEIIEKAKRYEAGVAMEELSFRCQTKRWLIPRYQLMVAVRNICERQGIPFKLVSAKNTSITCPKCDYANKSNRNGKRFKCQKCGYQADADIVASMNIGREAIDIGLMPVPKTSRLNAEEGREVATRLSLNIDDAS
jgi:hypothetical protein